ncbi:16S rRNA (cytosine967-C5)-methyltransferase [Roseiarcus fermentans]|uniref:16S rRNA (Cytosine967-C5)-methyltransferase n=1 Tax=Roseiarcus fermentans TaxID=1473586 RepID=A0A366FPP7_9HYPH|nr:transcription antitermination factor NusB [Roseiarcus fermentans]RBP16531.1 16S rRNA (cytosine967-C5)-methyltransferase [Roseiarcus fermentans]
MIRQQRGFSGPRARTPEPPQPGLTARIAAARAVVEAVTMARPVDERLAADLSLRDPRLDPRDRALARSIATVALRRLGTIRKALAQRMEKGLPRRCGALEWTLVAGAAQLLFMETPDHAAVDLAVRAARADAASAPFAGLANAVLRAVARDRDAILAASDPLDDDTPPWLAARWRATWGEEAARAIAAANRCEPTLDLSVKSDPQQWADRLGGVVLPTGSVRLDSHRPIAELEGYGDGEWWVQDAAAALPARLLGPRAGLRVVDLCAAPGGKSAELAAAGASVVTVDRSAERLKVLAANFERLKLHADIVVADALAFDAPLFDAALLDAPCTATGTIRRHPDVAWLKRPADLAVLVKLQAQLLDKAVALTRPGGPIVYCTCSLEPEEGEAQITALLRRNPDVARSPISVGEIGGLSQCLTPAGELRTLPFHLWGDNPRRSGLDGFFAARLVKTG